MEETQGGYSVVTTVTLVVRSVSGERVFGWRAKSRSCRVLWSHFVLSLKCKPVEFSSPSCCKSMKVWPQLELLGFRLSQCPLYFSEGDYPE